MKRKLRHLPGTALSPELVLHRTLEKLERIKSVVVVIQWDDDTFDVDWSAMGSSGTLLVAAMALEEEARAQCREP